MSRFLTPEHLHAMLNHLPLVGLGCAAFVLLVGLLRRKPDGLVIGFVMCVLFGGAMVPVMTTGESAEDRVAAFAPPLDAAGKVLLEQHEDRAQYAAVLAYVVAGLGLLGLGLTQWQPHRARYVGWLTVTMLAAALGLIMWTAEAGGQIRHPEFRSASPAPVGHSHD